MERRFLQAKANAFQQWQNLGKVIDRLWIIAAYLSFIWLVGGSTIPFIPMHSLWLATGTVMIGAICILALLLDCFQRIRNRAQTYIDNRN